jgi:beta-N-acetylhexosaminidase
LGFLLKLINRRKFVSSLASVGSAPLLFFKPVDAAAPSERLSLDQMIGQMIVMGFWGSQSSATGAQAIIEWLHGGLIGGVIFFEDNLGSAETVQQFTRTFREAAKPLIPLLCVDQEGGAVARLQADRGFEPLPSARSVGEMSLEKAAALYDKTAAELHRLGLNVNFAPVVDLAVNPGSRIIAGLGRSFSIDPGAVETHAKVFIQAHRRNSCGFRRSRPCIPI